jgi:hypothetical protein
MVCPGKLVDTIGLNHDGLDKDSKKEEYNVLYEGKTVKISPLNWPVYNLLDTIEKEKISEASFFLVLDSNIPRIGTSLELATDFIKSLGCRTTRVLNKFRYDEPDHVNLQMPGDIIVPNHAAQHNTLPKFVGQTCTFALSPDWRKKIVENDLFAVRSLVNIEECKALKKQKEDDQRILDEKPRNEYSSESCSYDVPVGTGGGSESNPFPNSPSCEPSSEPSRGSVSAQIPIGDTGASVQFNLPVGPKRGGGGGGGFTTTERRIDQDCADRRTKHNERIDAHNAQLHEKQALVLATRASNDEKLSKCYLIPNWEQK